MTESNTTLFSTQPTPRYAAWATQPRRRFRGINAAIIRANPPALRTLALTLCALSATGIALLLAVAMGAAPGAI